MEHVLVRRAKRDELEGDMLRFLAPAPDASLFDRDLLNHDSTFALAAFNSSGVLAFLPMQQPLMMDMLILRPGLSKGEAAQAAVRLAEHAVEEAYLRDCGEVYFLTREPAMHKFAERHGFHLLPENLSVRRLHLRETFGA